MALWFLLGLVLPVIYAWVSYESQGCCYGLCVLREHASSFMFVENGLCSDMLVVTLNRGDALLEPFHMKQTMTHELALEARSYHLALFITPIQSDYRFFATQPSIAFTSVAEKTR